VTDSEKAKAQKKSMKQIKEDEVVSEKGDETSEKLKSRERSKVIEGR